MLLATVTVQVENVGSVFMTLLVSTVRSVYQITMEMLSLQRKGTAKHATVIILAQSALVLVYSSVTQAQEIAHVCPMFEVDSVIAVNLGSGI